VLDPRDTRDWLRQMLSIGRHGPRGGVGEHLLRNWPTTF
jgi:hypothetical protein